MAIRFRQRLSSSFSPPSSFSHIHLSIHLSLISTYFSTLILSFLDDLIDPQHKTFNYKSFSHYRFYDSFCLVVVVLVVIPW